MKKTKILNAVLILTSLIGYLEWGHGNTMFLMQAEGEVLSKLFSDPLSVLHPFTLLPLIGQLLLLITLFQQRPNRYLTLVGGVGIGVLLGFMLFVGLLSLNYKILVSTWPYLITGVLAIRHHRSLRHVR